MYQVETICPYHLIKFFGSCPECPAPILTTNNQSGEVTYIDLRKTSLQWYDQLYPNKEVIIKDPDGWDRSNYDYSYYEELITKDEFLSRVVKSTCLTYKTPPMTIDTTDKIVEGNKLILSIDEKETILKMREGYFLCFQWGVKRWHLFSLEKDHSIVRKKIVDKLIKEDIVRISERLNTRTYYKLTELGKTIQL